MELNLRKQILFSLMSLIILGSFAARADLYIVQLQHQKFTYVLPALPSESAEEALKAYIKFVSEHEGLKTEIPIEQLKTMKISRIIVESELLTKPRLLILANRAYDHTVSEKFGGMKRIINIMQMLNDKSHAIVMPVAATARFEADAQKRIHSELMHKFDGAMALGGADVDPEIYNETAQGARDYNYWRDFYEVHFIREWVSHKTKALFGICRGHQLVSAALGLKLNQHIEGHGDGAWIGHPIHIKKTTRNRLYNLFSSTVARVSSYHHQAVSPIIPENLKNEIEIAAVAEDGTVESIESKDGRIWTFQFHPEFMKNRVGRQIFSLINSILYDRFTHASPRAGRCEGLF